MTGQPEPRQKLKDRSRPVAGEMRLATVMMVDLVGSTEISERLGPEASFLLLRDVKDLIRSTVAAHGGFIVDEAGDGLFALFGAPMSVERASAAACRAALAVCQGMRERSEAFQTLFSLSPQIRVGLSSGEVLITGTASDGSLKATGSAVNLSARLQAMAGSGQVVCAGSVVSETRGWARFTPIGPREVKGFAAPVETHLLLDAASGRDDQPFGITRFGGEFVGREAEIAHLLQWQAGRGGPHPVTLIVGEAGIGKSRLLAEIAQRIGDRKLVLGSCQPTVTARALAPLIEILRQFIGWHPEIGNEAIFAAARPILPDNSTEREALIALIRNQSAPQVGNDPSYALTLRRALSEAILRLGSRTDCLIAIEDVHWIDPLSAEVLLAVIATAPPGFRMLGTTRPVDWIARLSKDRVDTIVAGPMQPADIAVIAHSVMGDATGEDLVDQVTRRSEGNPFFAIEILHNILVHGVGFEAGRIGTIQNVALARFDQLDPSVRELLRMAAVLGRTFHLDVLAVAAKAQGKTLDRLPDLAEGIIDRGYPDDANAPVSFQHILFRDSIYATIPPALRKTMHLAAAQAIETSAGKNREVAPDVLADHYELAGEHRRAVFYLRQAAQQAYGIYAVESCQSLTERALVQIGAAMGDFETEDIEEVLSLRLRCLDLTDQFREIIRVSSEWLQRLRTGEGNTVQAELLALTSKAHCHLGNFEESHRLVLEALQMATAFGDAKVIAYAKVVLMRSLVDSGRGSLGDVERLFEETREESEKLSDDPLYSNRMFHMMSAYRTEGLMARALAIHGELLAFAERRNRAHERLVSHWTMGVIAIQTSDFRTGLSHAEACLQNSIRYSAVWDIGMMQKLSSQLNLGMDVSPDAIRAVMDRADLRGELVTRNAGAFILAIAYFSKGQLVEGWKQLRRCELLYQAAAHVEYRRLSLLYRAELLLTLSGFIKVDRPRPKLGPADIALAIYIRLTGRQKATRLLDELLSQLRRPDGYILARAKACQAAIAAGAGRKEEAATLFSQSEQLFMAEGLPKELARLASMKAVAGV